MTISTTATKSLRPESAAVYRRMVRVLNEANVPFLVGGAYALAHYAGIVRHTKDLDLFLREQDVARTLATLASSLDCRTELTSPRWLGKAFCGKDFCDIIFNSDNGLARVDDLWFAYAVATELFGEPVWIIPVEEMIWSKGYVFERDRYDGADIHHLLRACGDQLDWSRLLDRFGPHWRVLLSHLILFGFVYPGEQERIPRWVMDELLARLHEERRDPPPERLCRGTLLSRQQYTMDIQEWGYQDARRIRDDCRLPIEDCRLTRKGWVLVNRQS